MKHALFSFVLLAACGAFAAPGALTVNSVTPNAGDGTVTISYDLAGDEAAIVTMSVTVGGVTYERLTVAGDVARRVTAATGKSITWDPRGDVPGGSYDAGSMTVNLKAWSLQTPPDYMAVNLIGFKHILYYASLDALPEPVSSKRWREEWMLFRRIPAKGVTWRMGVSSRDYCWSPNEHANASLGYQAPREVTNDADFYIGVFEVTQEQYYRITKSRPSTIGSSAWNTLPNSSHYAAHQIDWKWHPVESVTWTLANVVATKLADYSGLPIKLPSSQQWEYACRGETKGSTYYVSNLADLKQNDPDHIRPIGVNFQVQDSYYGGGQNVGHPQYACHLPVGQKTPNKWGVYDMIGNVGEWCSGYYDEAAGTRPYRGGWIKMSGEGMGAGYCLGVGPDSFSDSGYCCGMRLACAIP